MPRAKTPRSATPSNKQVITMPEAGASTPIRKTTPPSAPTPIDLQSQIQRRAYELYEQRGCAHGHEVEDWFQAEREVLARQSQSKAQSA